MPIAELLRVAGALAAPAFFLFFGLAALGAPLLALVCFMVAQTRRTQHPEAYGRRLLRMALSCGLPTFLVLFGSAVLGALRVPWLYDWFLAAPLVPGLLAVTALAYCGSLLTLRLARPGRHQHKQGRAAQALILSLLSLTFLWLFLTLLNSLTAQAQAVLAAPREGGVSVVPLLRPDLTEVPTLLWAALLAAIPLATACAGACSLEYLILLRDREPFGREAFAHALRLAARATLRSTLLAAAILPLLWSRLSDPPMAPGDAGAAKNFLAACGTALLLACVLWAFLARSNRPYSRPFLTHASVLLVWSALICLLTTGLLCFYAT